MKKIIIYLNCMKSRCFMLVACLALMASVTSCSEDYFEENIPEKSKQLSKAELIEQALSLKAKTRAIPPYPVVMITSKSTVSISCHTTESTIIHWGDGEETLIPAGWTTGSYPEYSHAYPDNNPHVIYIETSNEAIQFLGVGWNELELLDVTGNTNLVELQCSGNDLEELDLTGCPNLQFLYVSDNKLSAMDFTYLPRLQGLALDNNLFTDINVSENLELTNFDIGNNPITDIDLTNNIALKNIDLWGVAIKTINNLQINAKSFAVFPKLERLTISSTPFTSLDLSNNPLVKNLSISATAITQLDISNLQICYLDASDSQLTNLTYTSRNLDPDAYHISILRTPFQEVKSNVQSLVLALPSRKDISQGLLCTTSTYIEPWRSFLTAKNWKVFP